jgi:hypothetical protein
MSNGVIDFVLEHFNRAVNYSNIKNLVDMAIFYNSKLIIIIKIFIERFFIIKIKINRYYIFKII